MLPNEVKTPGVYWARCPHHGMTTGIHRSRFHDDVWRVVYVSHHPADDDPRVSCSRDDMSLPLAAFGEYAGPIPTPDVAANAHEILAALAAWYADGSTGPIKHAMFDETRTWGQVIDEYMAKVKG